MTGSYQSWASITPESKTANTFNPPVIDAGGVHYRELNERIRELARAGERYIRVRGLRGQRYLGAGLDFSDLLLQLYGVAGEDMGFNLNGPTVELFGHGQNAIANTMDSGTIIVHGMGGDALAYGMRGGSLFIRDDVGYRVGIHMKEYRGKKPLLVIGGTSGDYLGEYMAGGTIILLNRENAPEMVAGSSDKTLATGIHGGEIYIFGYEIPDYLLGIGAGISTAGKADRKNVEPFVRQFCGHFGLEADPLLERELVKITPQGSRPFARFYYPAYPVNTGFAPEHAEGVSPCEAACPAGVPTGRFLRHLRLGEVERALELLDEYTPLRYSCCGFICPHLCMEACTRGRVDFPVRTAALARRFKSAPEAKPGLIQEKRDGEIAVIGAGPAGLSAAYQLARRGYGVTVFDEGDRPGGKLYQVISRERLPIDDLQYDMERIEKLGVRFVLNTRVDAGRFREILQQFDHVVVAVGAQKAVLPPAKGQRYLKAGLDFLKEYNSGLIKGRPPPKPGARAAVIGGGDSAVDGIEALINTGVEPTCITVIDVKKPSAAPQARRELESRGVQFRYPFFIKEATAEGIYARGMLGEEEFIPAETVLVFINEQPELDFLPAEMLAGCDERGFYSGDGEAGFATAHPRISVVGDVQGLGLVTTNIGRGRECALRIDALLDGREYVPEEKQPLDITGLPQKACPLREDDISIEEEYDRCLHCGICVQCDDCVNACPRTAITREGETISFDLSRCGGCGSCAAACRGGVIQMVRR